MYIYVHNTYDFANDTPPMCHVNGTNICIQQVGHTLPFFPITPSLSARLDVIILCFLFHHIMNSGGDANRSLVFVVILTTPEHFNFGPQQFWEEQLSRRRQASE